jgi:hypothetical protein
MRKMANGAGTNWPRVIHESRYAEAPSHRSLRDGCLMASVPGTRCQGTVTKFLRDRKHCIDIESCPCAFAALFAFFALFAAINFPQSRPRKRGVLQDYRRTDPFSGKKTGR